MNMLFLMDPLETVKMEKDTSFILMLGAQRRGHKIYCVFDGGISFQENKIYFKALSVVPQAIMGNPFHIREELILCADDVDAVFVRRDPPFDETYLAHTWLLDLLPKHIPVINTPAGLRAANEKIWAAQFVALTPKTLISRRKQDILSFLGRENDIVAKPTNGYGGFSVFHVKKGDLNALAMLEAVSKNWSRDIVVQKYIPDAQNGDKRILLLDGEFLGAVLRVHAPDDHRNNFFAGGHPQATEITARERRIIETLKPELKRLGLYFVGIDIIGDLLIEVNVTSPTCLQEMNRLYGKNLEVAVIEFAEQLVKQLLPRKA